VPPYWLAIEFLLSWQIDARPLAIGGEKPLVTFVINNSLLKNQVHFF